MDVSLAFNFMGKILFIFEDLDEILTDFENLNSILTVLFSIFWTENHTTANFLTKHFSNKFLTVKGMSQHVNSRISCNNQQSSWLVCTAKTNYYCIDITYVIIIKLSCKISRVKYDYYTVVTFTHMYTCNVSKKNVLILLYRSVFNID